MEIKGEGTSLGQGRSDAGEAGAGIVAAPGAGQGRDISSPQSIPVPQSGPVSHQLPSPPDPVPRSQPPHIPGDAAESAVIDS